MRGRFQTICNGGGGCNTARRQSQTSSSSVANCFQIHTSPRRRASGSAHAHRTCSATDLLTRLTRKVWRHFADMPGRTILSVLKLMKKNSKFIIQSVIVVRHIWHLAWYNRPPFAQCLRWSSNNEIIHERKMKWTANFHGFVNRMVGTRQHGEENATVGGGCIYDVSTDRGGRAPKAGKESIDKVLNADRGGGDQKSQKFEDITS